MTKFLADAREFMPILLQGVWLTIVVTCGSLALSTLLGMIWALMRVCAEGGVLAPHDHAEELDGELSDHQQGSGGGGWSPGSHRRRRSSTTHSC